MRRSSRAGWLRQKHFGAGVTNRAGRANTRLMARNQEERSDGDLLGAVAAGESAAFPVFYRRYLPRVVGLLMRQTGDREVAADLAAGVFAAVLLSAGRFRRSD